MILIEGSDVFIKKNDTYIIVVKDMEGRDISMRPTTYQKRPTTFQKRPTTYQKRPTAFPGYRRQ
jgi:hypothetical protein